MKRSYEYRQLEVASFAALPDTYMPDKWQILEVRQSEKDRSYPP